MTARVRLIVFLIAAVGLGAVYISAARNLPPWGEYRGPLGDVISGLAVYERHATDVVNAIDYDYRGFDTLGEEFILFSAVVGVMMLLRPEKKKPEKEKPGKKKQGELPTSFKDRATMSETVCIFSNLTAGVTVLFGIYIASHGQLTPGGGFQGGVVIAAAPMLIYIAQNTEVFQQITSHPLLEIVEALGASGYGIIGLIPLILGVPLLTNVYPLGVTGNLLSSGSIALISACVGIEVAAAFMLLSYEYLREIVAHSKGDE
ncbi:MAG: MnhB domain-containing protein [Acidobacteriaceae bacterium]